MGCPADWNGPITVELVGRVERDVGPVLYRIRVTSLQACHNIHRRYSDFVTLDTALRNQAVVGHLKTPAPLPPKRGLKGRFSLGSAVAKEQGLRIYLCNFAATDPRVQ